VSAYHHNNTIFLFRLPASSSPHAITKRTTRGPLGRGYLLQARFELPLDGGCYARHSHTASSRPASLPTPQSVPAQCTQTNHKIPIKVIHYLHYRSRRGDGRAVDHQTPHGFGCIAVSSQLSHGHTITHTSQFSNAGCAASRLNGASFRGRGRCCAFESHVQVRTTLGDVATYCARFGGRPMGLGISEAANRITKVTKRAVWTTTGEYKHGGAFEPYPQRPSPYTRFVHLENSTPTPDRRCLNTATM
jgi:hypothetical protein